MKNIFKKFPVIIIIAIIIMDVLPSCYDKDFLDISDTINWHPSFSLPIGSSSFEVDNFFDTIPNISDILDTLSTLPDSLSYLPDSVSGFPDSLIIHILDSIGILDTLGFDSVFFNNELRYFVQEKIPINDNFDFDFSDVDEKYDIIDSMLFKINLKNGFPTDADVQIYLIDSVDNVIDSLFSKPENRFFPAAEVDEEEKVINPTHINFDIDLSRERIDNIKKARNLLFNVNLSIKNKDIKVVSFFSSYEIDLKLGLRIAFHSNLPNSNSDNNY
ncbi:MAG: hypothetical protein IMY72_04340 [Bacteroidetes bacterium]|nr:hypothetical protein [Bacteroidota bacterium]